jgi:putative endonuclease
MKHLTTESGRQAEDRALAYLQTQGLVLITRNFRSRRGEIDLVMRDAATLVFVEVRKRRSQRFGGAAAGCGVAPSFSCCATRQHLRVGSMQFALMERT